MKSAVAPAPTYFAACSDPGGASALAPVLAGLRAGSRLHAFAHGPAVSILGDWGIRSQPPALLPPMLPADAIVLLATSARNGFDLERRLLLVADAQGLPSLLIMDFWSNYVDRLPVRNGRPVMPTRMLAIDGTMADGLAAAGVPRQRIAVTGHPGFDPLARARKAFDRKARDIVRDRHGAREGESLVLFAAHPGYFDGDADGFEDCLCALGEAAEAVDRAVLLAIRPHPRDPTPRVPKRDGSRVRTVTASPGTAREAALASDLIMGETTMLLVESTLLRRPTVSLRLGRTGAPDPLPRFVPRARSALELSRMVTSALRGEPLAADEDPPVLDGEATARALDEVASLNSSVGPKSRGQHP